MDAPLLPGAPMDSPFEEDVAHALQQHGHRVEPQVGSSGFRIDLAVRDPDDEGRFLLAVECDGARYHSSSWARGRDRQRQTVLEQKGWTFHRIWSTDWFYNRDAELDKLLEAVERARANRSRERASAPATVKTRVERVQRAASSPETEPKHPAYREADFLMPERASYDLHEVSPVDLAPHVVRIVEEEGPVHIAEVARRMSRLWGYKRCGARIQEAVEQAVRTAVQEGLVRYAAAGRQQFLECEDSAPVVVRDRSKASPTLRDPNMLPPSEIEVAIRQVVKRNVAIRAEECAVEVARTFGFKSTSANLRRHLESHVQEMVAGRSLVERDGVLRLPGD